MHNDNIDYIETARQAVSEGFYSPHVSVDYAEWARFSIWTAEQAIALSFGLDPHEVDWNKIELQAQQSQLARQMSHSRKRLKTAQASGDIALPTRPHFYMDWVKARCIAVPDGLAEAVNKCGRPVPDWELMYRECAAKLSVLEKQSLSKGAELDTQPNTQARRTYLRLILGLAIGGYGYNPAQERNAVTREIYDDLNELELKVSRGTIVEKLQEAEEGLDFQMPTEWQAKRSR